MRIKIVLSFLLPILINSCGNENSLTGNYSNCSYGEYVEMYFKKDSIRVAQDSEWVGLSNWKHFKMNKDTIFYETFGEWRYPTASIIKFHDFGTMEIKSLNIKNEVNSSIFIEPIKGKVNFNSNFWRDFNKRKLDCDCQ